MPCTFRLRRWKRPFLVGVVLHLLFLVTSPFEHHDIICHLKTPLHCTACASTQLGSDPHPLVAPGLACLADAGQAAAASFLEKGTVLVVHSSGRSPPFVV